MIGNGGLWVERYRSIDTRFMKLVVEIWGACVVGLGSNPDEDTITIQLVSALSRDYRARRLGVIEYQYEPFGYRDDGIAYSKGKIDVSVLLDRTRDNYLAYECKRLNVVRSGKRESLATRYVMCGLRRFITEQYSEDLPVGCMLGYVLDGDVPFALKKVLDAIERRRSEVGLDETPMKSRDIRGVERFVSRHVRDHSGERIEVRHTMLAFPS